MRKCFFGDPRRAELSNACGLAITKLPGHPDPLTYSEPKTELGKRLQKNVRWLYSPTAAATGLVTSRPCPVMTLAVLFSLFLMGEIAATIFKQMYENSREAVFKEGSRTSAATKPPHGDLHGGDGARLPGPQGRDQGHRHQADPPAYLFLSAVLFEPPMESLGPARKTSSSATSAHEEAGSAALFRHPTYEAKLQNWEERHDQPEGRASTATTSPFPAIPGITGQKSAIWTLEDIIPVF